MSVMPQPSAPSKPDPALSSLRLPLTTAGIIRRPVSEQMHLLPKDLPLVLKRIYSSRGLLSEDELQLGLQQLPKPNSLPGMQAAVQLLQQALQQQWRIVVIGDFDADGATSTAVALRALRQMGAHWVDFLVPNRIEHGYGLSPEIVEIACTMWPDLLITVDNGIASIDGAMAAKAAGLKLLITDHHLPGEQLPEADAIVNPSLDKAATVAQALAGVGVIFYVMLALRGALRQQNWFAEKQLAEPNLAELLDLVALGTVADVVPLNHCNRILVEQGLRRIRAGRACPAILALLEVAGRSHERVAASDMGFAVGPRLNAAGRLDDMSHGIECLLTDDANRARELAAELDSINRERRSVEAGMRAEAEQAVQRLQLGNSALPLVLCLYEKDWHPGVVGLVASRLKERLHRPVFAFAEDGQQGLKGSARSVPGIHIRDLLAAVDAQHPGMIERFGGHAMAAGLTLPRANLAALQQALNQQLALVAKEEQLQATVLTDGELADNELHLATAELLRGAGPWGQAFSEPRFDGEFVVQQARELKGGHLKLVVQTAAGTALDAILFNYNGAAVARGQRVQLAYKLDVNEFRGQRSAQLMLDYLRLVP